MRRLLDVEVMGWRDGDELEELGGMGFLVVGVPVVCAALRAAAAG